MSDWTTAVAVLGAALIAPATTVYATHLANQGKRKEEARLAEASRAEIDTRIVESFTTLMGKANARGEGVVAEAVLVAAIDKGLVKPQTGKELQSLIRDCSVNLPIGHAEQVAATAAIAALALNHGMLLEPAIAGLEHVVEFQPRAQAHLERLQRHLADQRAADDG